MQHAHALLLLIGLCVVADDKKYPEWPISPVQPTPAPKVLVPIDQLPSGKLYVVQHNDAPAQLLCSPPGIAEIKEYKDAVTIDGVFVDGVPEGETRDYKAKQIFRVKRVLPGQFELLKVPAGPVERRLLTDTVPTPMPPGPTPPGPTPPAPVPAKTMRVIFAVESGATLTPAQQGVVYGVEVENWCVKNCTGGKDGFKRRDKDNPAVAGNEMQTIWAAAKPLITTTPVAIVEKNSHIEIIPLEATPAAMIAVFNEYLTGKRGK